LLPTIIAAALTIPLYAVFFVAYGFSPKTLEVGYQPKQPVPFSHALHAGELGMDCRYCHTSVEKAGARERASDADLHELPHADSSAEPEARAGARELREPAFPSSGPASTSCLTSRTSTTSAHVNRGIGCVLLPRTHRHDGSRLPEVAALDGMVP
jgi:hypothetical protein